MEKEEKEKIARNCMMLIRFVSDFINDRFSVSECFLFVFLTFACPFTCSPKGTSLPPSKPVKGTSLAFVGKGCVPVN